MLGGFYAAAQSCRRRRTRASSVLAFAWLAACADDAAVETTPDQAHLFEQRLPVLGCFEPVQSPGSCHRNEDCVDPTQRCVHDVAGVNEDRQPVPLTCGAPIGTGAAHADCTRGSDCASGLCALTGVCVDPCASNDDCGLHDACRPLETRLGDDALAPTMACTRALVLPADVTYTTAPRGFSLGKGRGQLQLPGSSASSLLYVQGDCGSSLDLLTLRDDDLGRLVYDRDALREGARQENTILHDGSALAAVQFPNNPMLPPMTGGLTLGVRAGNAQRAEALIVSRAPGRGVLDINLFYVGGGSEMEEGGFRPGDPHVHAMLADFDARLATMGGLSLGNVTEFEVVGELREELSVLPVTKRKVGEREVIGRPQNLDRLFRLSAGIELPGVNVFLVRDMGDYIGIAGGIPGPLGLHGTERSGVALAADLMGDMVGADQVLLHEIGHFLGLFHTSESSGTVLDPLSDTPDCDLQYDTNGDGVLGTEECKERGAENLMFWTGPGVVLSPQQIQVFASSVALR